MAEKKTPETEAELTEVLRVRREKLAQLVEDGKDPFQITKFDVTHHSAEIKDDFDVFVFDIYGVIWDGKKVIAGFDEVMKILTQSGKRVVIMSNSTALSPAQETVYAGRGFLRGVHYERLVTSGDAAEDAFSRDVRKLKFYQFGRPSKVLFARSPYQELPAPEEADFVYAGVPQTREGDYWKDYLTMEPFAEELGYLVSLGKPLICANPDCRAFENQYDEPVVRQGSVAELYEKLGGKVIYYGEPDAAKPDADGGRYVGNGY